MRLSILLLLASSISASSSYAVEIAFTRKPDADTGGGVRRGETPRWLPDARRLRPVDTPCAAGRDCGLSGQSSSRRRAVAVEHRRPNLPHPYRRRAAAGLEKRAANIQTLRRADVLVRFDVDEFGRVYVLGQQLPTADVAVFVQQSKRATPVGHSYQVIVRGKKREFLTIERHSRN